MRKGYILPKKRFKAIQEAPQPHNLAELRSFLGIINYYGKFLPNLSTKLAPLYQLLKRGSRWQWGKAQADAFTVAKKALQDDTLLVHYDSKRQVVLACDASPYGLGAVLSHIMEDGQERPIAYASRTLTAQKRITASLRKKPLELYLGFKSFTTTFMGENSSLSLIIDH